MTRIKGFKAPNTIMLYNGILALNPSIWVLGPLRCSIGLEGHTVIGVLEPCSSTSKGTCFYLSSVWLSSAGQTLSKTAAGNSASAFNRGPMF